jgi:hypothetical protein
VPEDVPALAVDLEVDVGVERVEPGLRLVQERLIEARRVEHEPARLGLVMVPPAGEHERRARALPLEMPEPLAHPVDLHRDAHRALARAEGAPIEGEELRVPPAHAEPQLDRAPDVERHAAEPDPRPAARDHVVGDGAQVHELRVRERARIPAHHRRQHDAMRRVLVVAAPAPAEEDAQRVAVARERAGVVAAAQQVVEERLERGDVDVVHVPLRVEPGAQMDRERRAIARHRAGRRREGALVEEVVDRAAEAAPLGPVSQLAPPRLAGEVVEQRPLPPLGNVLMLGALALVGPARRARVAERDVARPAPRTEVGGPPATALLETGAQVIRPVRPLG